MDMHEARTSLSGQVPAAASGWAFIVARSGRPLANCLQPAPAINRMAAFPVLLTLSGIRWFADRSARNEPRLDCRPCR